MVVVKCGWPRVSQALWRRRRDKDKEEIDRGLNDDRGIKWTAAQGEELQKAVDRIFGRDGGRLSCLEFSFTIADPRFADCPLIGCSTGFATLCGYQMGDIVGRNCRFLVDPVPPELISSKVRHCAREFCNAARDGKDYLLDEKDREPWMPPGRHTDDGIFCIQTNARKDGSLFKNMFYMRVVELNDLPYVIALQTEIPGPLTETNLSLEICHMACRVLDKNMAGVEKALAKSFWLSTPMRRQEDGDEPLDGFGI